MYCSSGDQHYDTAAPAASLTAPNTLFASFFSHSHQQNPNLFDPSPSYFHHPLSQSQPPAASIPYSDPHCALPLIFSGNHSTGEAEHRHAVLRNSSKKRSRASRRPPTTVITTDPSNFRSMVREFTGVPAPPSSSASHSRRFHPFRPSPPNPSLRPSSSSLNTIANASSDLGYAFQTALHHSGSEWPSRF